MTIVVDFFWPILLRWQPRVSRQPETQLAFGVLVNYCLRHQVLLSVLLRFLMACQGIRDRGSTARYGLTRTVVRPACHVLLEPLTSSYVPTKFGYVYQFPPRFSTVKHGRCVELSLCPRYKMRPTKLLQSLIRKHP